MCVTSLCAVLIHWQMSGVKCKIGQEKHIFQGQWGYAHFSLIVIIFLYVWYVNKVYQSWKSITLNDIMTLIIIRLTINL